MKLFSIYFDIVFMFISGIVLLPLFHIDWSLVRVVTFVHIFGSLLVSVLFVIPFLYHHVKESVFEHQKRSKSGVWFGVVLFLLFGSGLYLFLVGNRGGDIWGVVAYNIHLYGSFVLLGLLFSHLRVMRGFLILVIPFLGYGDEVALIQTSHGDGVKRYHAKDWTNSVTCKVCHPLIFQQWANSNHRHLADSNPYYMVLENLAGTDMGEDFRRWCMGCHNPSAVSMNQQKTTHFMDDNTMPDPLFVHNSATLVKNYKEDPNRLEQGVSCIACHRITDANATGNASFVLNLTQRKKYLFEDAHTNVKMWIGEKLINAHPTIHKQEYSNSLYQKSAYCASCHNEFLPHSKKMVVSTYEQWEKSPFNNPDDPSKHKDCIDCHMGYIKDGVYVPQQGKTTLGGKEKKDIRTHYFTGANHFLAGLKSKEHEKQSLELLKTAAKLDVALQNKTLIVGVTNVGAGHKLPTGAADFRELWLDITLKDKTGKVILSSGKLDKDGNIEKNAVIFHKVFGDKDGNPVGLFFWRYEKLLKDTRIDAGERVQEEFLLPENLAYPLEVRVKLHFRIYPQWVSDIVQVAYPQLPNPPVVTIAEVEKKFE